MLLTSAVTVASNLPSGKMLVYTVASSFFAATFDTSTPSTLYTNFFIETSFGRLSVNVTLFALTDPVFFTVNVYFI